jgi:hypothetical protein
MDPMTANRLVDRKNIITASKKRVQNMQGNAIILVEVPTAALSSTNNLFQFLPLITLLARSRAK